MRLVERIEQRAVGQLSPYAHNARVHSAEQVAQIAESIKTFGFNNPILIDAEGGIIAGHGRYAAALKLGLPEVPVIVLDHLTDRERRAYIIADNKLAENATWDDAVLAAELAALNEMEFDLSILGFEDAEIDRMLNGESTPGGGTGSLAERFIVPPFSVLDARQGYWQERKRAWLALGIESELGRGGGHLAGVSDRRPD